MPIFFNSFPIYILEGWHWKTPEHKAFLCANVPLTHAHKYQSKPKSHYPASEEEPGFFIPAMPKSEKRDVEPFCGNAITSSSNSFLPNMELTEGRTNAGECLRVSRRRRSGLKRSRALEKRKHMERIFWENQKRMENIEKIVERLVQQLSSEEGKLESGAPLKEGQSSI